MTHSLPELPPWLVDLPRDHRGFPVPAEAGWEDGQPRLAVVATERKIALGMRRRCAVCGFGLEGDRTVYRAFAQSDAAHMRQYERTRSNDLGGPVHLSCILFSAMVCPYLRERTSRLGKQSNIDPGARRGTLAAVMGFRDFGLLMFAEPHKFLDPTKPPPHFAYRDLCEDIRYRDGEELADRYRDAIASDTEHIDTEEGRLFWKDSKAELRELGRLLRADFDRMSGAKPDYQQVIQGMGRYVALPI